MTSSFEGFWIGDRKEEKILNVPFQFVDKKKYAHSGKFNSISCLRWYILKACEKTGRREKGKWQRAIQIIKGNVNFQPPVNTNY